MARTGINSIGSCTLNGKPHFGIKSNRQACFIRLYFHWLHRAMPPTGCSFRTLQLRFIRSPRPSTGLFHRASFVSSLFDHHRSPLSLSSRYLYSEHSTVSVSFAITSSTSPLLSTVVRLEMGRDLRR